MRIFVPALLSVVTAAAQVGVPMPGGIVPTPVIPIPGMSTELRQFLELTTDQVNAINRLNTELRRYQVDKARRAAQVRLELQEETSKETLDAMALGVRYLELEGIQRELTAKARETAAEVQKLFTPAQKTKLQALEQVLRMYPVACEAVNLNFITPTQPTRWFDPSASTGTLISGRVIIGMPTAGAGCGVMPWIQTGDFQP